MTSPATTTVTGTLPVTPQHEQSIHLLLHVHVHSILCNVLTGVLGIMTHTMYMYMYLYFMSWIKESLVKCYNCIGVHVLTVFFARQVNLSVCQKVELDLIILTSSFSFCSTRLGRSCLDVIIMCLQRNTYIAALVAQLMYMYMYMLCCFLWFNRGTYMVYICI